MWNKSIIAGLMLVTASAMAAPAGAEEKNCPTGSHPGNWSHECIANIQGISKGEMFSCYYGSTLMKTKNEQPYSIEKNGEWHRCIYADETSASDMDGGRYINYLE